MTKYFAILERRTLKILSDALDIADKYLLTDPDIFSAVLPVILHDWPETLQGWDAAEKHIHSLFIAVAESQGSGPTEALDKLLPDPAEAIALAVKHKWYTRAARDRRPGMPPSFLPAAFYHLSRVYPWADPEDESGMMNEDDYHDGVRTARRSLLRRRDLTVHLSNGAYHLRSQAAGIAFPDYSGNDHVVLRPGKRWELSKYTAGSEENEGMHRWWAQIAVERLVGLNRMDVLRSLRELIVALTDPNEGVEELTTKKAGDRNADVPEETDKEMKEMLTEEMRLLYQSTSSEYREAMKQWLLQEREDVWNNLMHNFSLARWFDE